LSSNPIDNAGNSLTAARDVILLGPPQSFADFVGDGSGNAPNDLDDFYRFVPGTDGPFGFVAQLNNLTANANMQLIRDGNSNFQVDTGEVLATTTVLGTGTDVISLTIDIPGTYFLRVFRATGQAEYSLVLNLVSQDTAGNSSENARELGTLTSSIVSPGHFVGRIDRNDFFRFEILASGELDVTLNGQDNGALPQLQIYFDDNGNLRADDDELLVERQVDTQPDFTFGILIDEPGTYFARVSNVVGSYLYSMELRTSPQRPFDEPFEISPLGPTEIKLVRFDRGGQGVSYFDTTPDNSGNQPGFRDGENIDVDVSTTNDPLSGGRRISNTAP
jgi:hypothetical protein